MSLRLVPITLKEASRFVAEHHRHHQPPRGGLFAVACADQVVRAVAIIGRPVARMSADGFTAEVTRLASDGARNACSMLYAAAWRACRALGYRRLITYTLPSEGGASLRAAGWVVVGQTRPGNWHRENRPRVDLHANQSKLRWEPAP